MSKVGITVGEKVMYPKAAANYPQTPQWTYSGEPWMFVLRDTAQFAKNMHDVEKILSSATRT
jgi:hypothetical protein